MKRFWIIALLLGLNTSIHAEEWDLDQAVQNIERLSPKAVSELPEPIQTYLFDQNLTVPISRLDYAGKSALQGQFFKKGQTDWAVLGSSENISSIYIFPNGDAVNVVVIETAPDKSYFEAEGSPGRGQLRYRRGLHLAGRKGGLKNLRKKWSFETRIKNEAIYTENGLCVDVYYFQSDKWKKMTLCGD